MPETPILVGTAGWSYADWEDVVYPRREKQKLRYLSRYLDCVEINSSFYRPFTPQSAEKWLDEVSDNDRFRFMVKLWSRFTHEKGGAYSKKDVEVFREGLRVLKEGKRLSGLLLQFPFFFRDSDRSRGLLERIAGDFADFPRVLEVRDASWSREDALDFITGLGLNIACLDMPLSRDAFREWALVTGELGYLRLHGRNRSAWFSKDSGRDEKYDYLYADDELDETLGRIDELRRKARLVVVVWNNHYRGKAAVNALQTLYRLLGKKVDVPPLLRRSYPALDPISRPESGSLFEH